jgi:hypothetical protein
MKGKIKKDLFKEIQMERERKQFSIEEVESTITYLV